MAWRAARWRNSTPSQRSGSMINTTRYLICANELRPAHCQHGCAPDPPLSRARRPAGARLRSRLAPRRATPALVTLGGRTLAVVAALGVLYVVWGSTYLGIALAIETM